MATFQGSASVPPEKIDENNCVACGAKGDKDVRLVREVHENLPMMLCVDYVTCRARTKAAEGR